MTDHSTRKENAAGAEPHRLEVRSFRGRSIPRISDQAVNEIVSVYARVMLSFSRRGVHSGKLPEIYVRKEKTLKANFLSGTKTAPELREIGAGLFADSKGHVIFEKEQKVIEFQDSKGQMIVTIPYDKIKSLLYEKTSRPRYTEAILISPRTLCLRALLGWMAAMALLPPAAQTQAVATTVTVGGLPSALAAHPCLSRSSRQLQHMRDAISPPLDPSK